MYKLSETYHVFFIPHKYMYKRLDPLATILGGLVAPFR